MDPITMYDALRALSGKGTLVGSSDLGARFTGVSTDSRTVKAGELFVAIPGERFDGNLFVKAALERGAAGAIAREDCPFQTVAGRPVLVVKDPVGALGELALAYREKLRARVIAITGSSGKTTTRDLVKHVLASAYRTVGAEKSHNNHIGVPITIFKASRETEALVLECGTSGPGEIAALARIARPDVSVVTNVGACHLEKLGDEDGVAREKGALVQALREGGVAVLNGDDPRTRAMAKGLGKGRRVILFGEGRATSFDAGRFALDPSGAEADAAPDAQAWIGPDALEGVTLPMEGRHNRMNALAAIAVAAALGMEPRTAARILEGAAPPGRRLERKALPGGVSIIDDAYNANPASTAAALEILAAEAGRKIFVFGGMRELGAHSERHHRAVGELAAKAGISLFAAVGPDARLAAQAAQAKGLPLASILLCETPEEAADRVAQRVTSHDRILVKGSRGAQLERFIDRLEARLGGGKPGGPAAITPGAAPSSAGEPVRPPASAPPGGGAPPPASGSGPTSRSARIRVR